MTRSLLLLFFATCASAQTPAPPAQAPAQSGPLAEDVYSNVVIFKGKPATRLLPAMIAIRGLLGVECTYCHTEHDWANESKPQKARARQMFTMVGDLDDNFFKANRVSCWTCHRGHSKPETLTPDPDMEARVARLIGIPTGSEKKPAEQVFKNIQKLQGVPAERFPEIMASFTLALGVRCNHCHAVDGNYATETEKKARAREMMTMLFATAKKYFDNSVPLGCSTCHHGSIKPELVAATEPAPSPAK